MTLLCLVFNKRAFGSVGKWINFLAERYTQNCNNFTIFPRFARLKPRAWGLDRTDNNTPFSMSTTACFPSQEILCFRCTSSRQPRCLAQSPKVLQKTHFTFFCSSSENVWKEPFPRCLCTQESCIFV